MRRAPSPDEMSQHQKALNFATQVVFIVSVAACFLIQRNDFLLSVFTTALTSVTCVIVYLMNRRGKTRSAGIILCATMYLAILIVSLDGYGLWDVSLIAYPFFIAASALCFGRKSVKYLTMAVVAAILIIFIHQQAGFIRPYSEMKSDQNLCFLLLILIGCSLIIWYFVNCVEEGLKRAQKSEASLINAYDHTLAGWVKALEYRDKETEEHSKRVVDMTVRLARAMGVPESNIVHYRRGALLHDIGKITIPDSILLKKTSLTKEEMSVMQTHPEIAGEMLSSVGFLAPALDIPVYHHEHWDGSGYPYGLKGEEIPFPARVFAVVDSWEALGSNRSYRSAWAQEMIIQYLNENKGILFDPQVVDAFLPLVYEGNHPSQVSE